VLLLRSRGQHVDQPGARSVRQDPGVQVLCSPRDAGRTDATASELRRRHAAGGGADGTLNIKDTRDTKACNRDSLLFVLRPWRSLLSSVSSAVASFYTDTKTAVVSLALARWWTVLHPLDAHAVVVIHGAATHVRVTLVDRCVDCRAVLRVARPSPFRARDHAG